MAINLEALVKALEEKDFDVVKGISPKLHDAAQNDYERMKFINLLQVDKVTTLIAEERLTLDDIVNSSAPNGGLHVRLYITFCEYAIELPEMKLDNWSDALREATQSAFNRLMHSELIVFSWAMQIRDKQLKTEMVEIRKAATIVSQSARKNGIFSKLPPELVRKIVDQSKLLDTNFAKKTFDRNFCRPVIVVK